MLTYDFSDLKEEPLYDYLYRKIRTDILAGHLKPGERMPSKRAFAVNLGISVITVETAYAQLTAEGYLNARPRSGYYVAQIHEALLVPEGPAAAGKQLDNPETRSPETRSPETRSPETRSPETQSPVNRSRLPEGTARGLANGAAGTRWEAQKSAVDSVIDLAQAGSDPSMFPFPVWSKLTREILRTRQSELLERSPGQGLEVLRRAIAGYLLQYRSLSVSPEQIIIGAGTEYLYGLLIRLLGNDLVYAVESPGYPKTARIYESSGVRVCPIPMDGKGMDVLKLRESGADVVHVSPSHQFPTGVTMPVSRRSELLAWSTEGNALRYIIEDDYDSEFRLSGRPIPSLMSIDRSGTVIYLNTFTKSVAPTIRISYMVLPEMLLARYRSKLGFYSCTVANYEQYILAEFIRRGHFEKHINRMRNQYRQKRDRLLDAIRRCGPEGSMEAEGADAGLHFLLHVSARCGEEELSRRAAASGVRIFGLGTYALQGVGETDRAEQDPCMVVSYSGLTDEQIPEATRRLKEAWSDQFVIAHTGKKRYNPK